MDNSLLNSLARIHTLPKNRAVVASKLTQLELERVDALSGLVEETAHAERDELYALAGDEDEGIENYAEEAHELESIGILFGQLTAVALYAVVEIRTKSALSWQASPEDVRRVYQVTALKRLFARCTKVQLASMPGFAAIDELRCINNAFKHSGLVSKQLAAYPGWIEGAQLGDVRQAVARIRPKVPVYLEAVAEALAP